MVEIGDEPGETHEGPTFDFKEAGTKICHHVSQSLIYNYILMI